MKLWPEFRLQSSIDWQAQIAALFKENGFLNICHEALDCQVAGPLRHSTAIRYVPPDWLTERALVQYISYEQLTKETQMFANALKKLGMKMFFFIITSRP